MSDPWFDERELERWTPRLPADELAELDVAIDRFRHLLVDPATPTLRIELADGSAYGPEEIAAIAAESAELLVGSVRAESIDAADLGDLISAATNLQVIAVTLVETLAAAGTGREDEAMGLAAALSRILQQAFGALDRSVVRTPDGTFRLRWSDADRALVRRLAAQLDASLDGDDESLVRLFPPAYGTDETRSREYAALAREELVESRFAAATAPGAVKNLQDAYATFYNPALTGDVPLWARVHSIKQPTVICWGRDDRVAPVEGALLPARRMPRCDLRIYSRCGHWVQVERKADFEKLVLDHFAGS